MYATLKAVLKKIIPTNLLSSLEPYFRYSYSLFYLGNKVQCPVCKGNFSRFIPIKIHETNSDLLCPRCGSIQRKRLLWLYLLNELKIESKKYSIIHFSPSTAFSIRLKKLSNIQYLTTNYGDLKTDRMYDITNIEEADHSFDIILAYHILEHIPDDHKAMNELFRILKKGGHALLQVPWTEKETYEDPTITSPTERLKAFGQEDHVRLYGINDFIERLSTAGFKVKPIKYAEHLGNDSIKKYGLRPEEIIFDCCKE